MGQRGVVAAGGNEFEEVEEEDGSFVFLLESVCPYTTMLRDACKVALVGVATYSAYQLTVVVVDAFVDAFWSEVERLTIRDIEKHYEVLGVIGELMCALGFTISGKTSTIYRARRKSDGTLVALKVISKLSFYAFESKAFETERRILSTLMHPNIVTLLGSDSMTWSNQLVLELSADGSVRAWMECDVGVSLCPRSWSSQRAARSPVDHADHGCGALPLQELQHSPSRHQTGEHPHFPNALLFEVAHGAILQCNRSGEFSQLQAVW